MNKLRTLLLIPHTHTDIGYTHDPIVVWELHKRFLDRAIELCERTADWPEGSRFRWTIEVLCVLDRWLETASQKQVTRLKNLIQNGSIALGARYAHGTFLYSPGDIDWEIRTVRRILETVEAPPQSLCLIQNDVNGLPRAIARRFHDEFGIHGLLMGLNATMGHPPLPRNTAFHWQLGGNRSLLGWLGWIYNCIKRYLHLDELADSLEGQFPKMAALLPPDYPFSFVQMSGTIHDNVGPFPRLSEQVRLFNEKGLPIRVELITGPEFLDRIRAELSADPVECSGEWNDAWPFGLGALPQHTASARRAQMRMDVIEALAQAGWTDPNHTHDLRDRTRRHLAMACEHTITTHRSKGELTLGNDALRQTTQNLVEFVSAESLSMLALRDSLREASQNLEVAKPGLVLANPFPDAISLRLALSKNDFVTCARSGMIEHVTEFDREPTLEDMGKAPDIEEETFTAAPGKIETHGLHFLDAPRSAPSEVPARLPRHKWSSETLEAAFDVKTGAMDSLKGRSSGKEWLPRLSDSFWKFGVPVVETLDPDCGGARYSPFMADTSEIEQRDPSDAPWNPNLRFLRQAATPSGATFLDSGTGLQTIAVRYQNCPVKTVRFSLDCLLPDTFLIEVDCSLGLDLHSHGVYLPLPFFHRTPEQSREECQFFVDACGDWTRVPQDQFPGSARSFYQAWRGVAVQSGEQSACVIAPEAPLWQLGGFTFGPPDAAPPPTHPLLLSWIYNNYWFTNFPTCAPGIFTLRYLLRVFDGPFQIENARRLYHQSLASYCAHILHPQTPYAPELPKRGLWL